MEHSSREVNLEIFVDRCQLNMLLPSIPSKVEWTNWEVYKHI